jgi:PAS domain S-box-containing protein
LALHLYFSHKLLLCYLFHAWEQAVQYAEQAEQTIDGVTSSAQVPFFYFYDSLARLALLRTHPPADETAWQTLLDKVDANQQKLQQWATHAPMNQQHRWCLVDAERARFSGNEGYAWQQYHQAIALAKEHGYLPEEALAYELLACFHEHKGEADVAALYMRKAHYGFQRWGALARTRFMEEQYAHLFKASQSKLSTSDPRRITVQLATEKTPTLPGTTDETAHLLDFASVIKASQTIAGEIVLDTLLAKLMDTMLENAGAERGLLLLERNGQWMIEAEGSIHAPPQVLQSIPLSETTALPHAVLNYVLHTHKSIVLNDAVETDQFGQDTYILQHHPRSILCTPLLSQGKLSGVLYLENRQTVGVFTTDRLQVLNLLYGHIAISLENAHLYAEVQEREQKYRTLFEETKDVIFISDLAGNILDMNPAGLLLFGLEQPEPNATLQQLAASPASQHELLQAITTDGLVHDFAITMRSTQGLLIECVLTATLHQTDDGSPMHLHGIIRDVTQQKQAEQERLQLTAMQRELAIARNIQQSLLPAPTPVWEQLDMVCYTTPAREVGGDWYAYHVFGQTEPAAAELSATTNDRARYALAVGDVSGKGVPAALLMAVSMASFRSVVEQQVPPATFLARMDKAIASYTHATRQNCALVYLELVAYEGAYTLLVANAGCIPPLLKRQDGEVCWIEVGGLPLGINMAHKVVYQEHRLHLAAGDMLILTSDGVVEATNADGEMFGFEQLEQVIAHAPAHTAEAMLTALRTAVETFVNDQEPHDDMTIVAVRVPG